MSKKIIINGPCTLKGKVKVQGAKNSSNRLALLSLCTEGTFEIDNFPRLGTTLMMLKLLKNTGAKIKWVKKHRVKIDTRFVKGPIYLPSETFYYTSSGFVAIPSLTHRFGECRIEKISGRVDYGGCQIGNRAMEHVIDTLKRCGISCKQNKKEYIFKVSSEKPFNYDVPWNSYGATINLLQAAFFKNGTSVIHHFTNEPEFEDILLMARQMGVKFRVEKNSLHIKGKTQLHGATFHSMSDRNDFATWIAIALATKSDLEIKNVGYERMKLDALDKVVSDMHIDLEYKNKSCFIYGSTSKLKPITMKGGRYPHFQTEWQVLFSPVMTQIPGKSKVIEMFYSNRMQHWKELSKLGANYTFYKSKITPEVPHSDPKTPPPPNAVKIFGPVKLHGARVKALDVRAGAAMIIAGLIADGKTEITNVGEIERGYENIVERLQFLGADIQLLSR